jgi:sulfur carrier protein
MTMNIKLNGENKNLDTKVNVIEFLENQLQKNEFKGIAVAKNGTIVPRSSWEKTLIEEDDEIEIVHAVQGG